MKMSGNTILITGGATGIGLALAEALLKAGNEVIICGRREDRLLEAKEKLPQLHIRVCDVADGEDRRSLLAWITVNFPGLNVLINNAGIQRDIDLTKGDEDLVNGEDEIKINFEAPVHLSALFIPHLTKKEEAAIVNVSSGLGFAPMAMFPVYCATKAGLHSFTMSLRHQLSQTSIKVFEAVPPLVISELNKEGRGKRNQQNFGAKAEDFADAVMKGLERDNFEIPFGTAENLISASRADLDRAFQMMNNR